MNSKREDIPHLTIRLVSQVLADFYGCEFEISALFKSAGAPAIGCTFDNTVNRLCQQALLALNADKTIEPLEILGRVIEEIMECDDLSSNGPLSLSEARSKIIIALEKKSLVYIGNGEIRGTIAPSSEKEVISLIQQQGLSGMEIEFARCLANVEKDPPASLTAACSLLEALFKFYIAENNLDLPNKKTIMGLWKVIQQDFGLHVNEHKDENIRKILSGLTTVVAGIGTLRTQEGSAHGRRLKQYLIKSRHARLAIHSANTVSIFLLETWDDKKTRR